MRFAFIAAEKAAFPVRVLCRILAVSRAGFYAAQARPAAAHTRRDQQLAVAIAAIHAETRQRYGSPRVHTELRARGQRVSRKRVARLMRQRDLAAAAGGGIGSRRTPGIPSPSRPTCWRASSRRPRPMRSG